MKEIKVKGLEIKVPDGSPFTYETAAMLPKAHQNCLVVAPRGQGKTTFVVNLMERMPYDRTIVVSPSIKSNKTLMSRLKIEPEDIYENPDDISLLDDIKAKIEGERDDYEKYHEDKKKYKELMRKLNDEQNNISDDLLMSFYINGNFEPPTHRYNGKKPCIAILFDDCLGSGIFTKGIRKLNALTIYHRHLGQLTEGGSVGASLYFLIQSYKCASGGISKCIRSNCTSLAVGRTKSDKELLDIAEECGGEISKDEFMAVHQQATKDSKFDMLLIDFHKKENHPSMFRKNLDVFIVP
tara:strand:- start:1665 stop:2552 length:888 start_codon:yes stop_codon:yes gene_type:complete